jgi:glycosyltransferase involved in cell wall biosynthesis
MSLRILNVAFPFAPTGPDAVGGAEQIPTRLDAALVAQGHSSFVVACPGSQAVGKLLVPAVWTPERAADSPAYGEYRLCIERAISRHSIDLIHLHGIDFYRYLPRTEIPVLVTLHLPAEWYPRDIFRSVPDNVWLHCVSRTQHAQCPASDHLLAPIENGVPIPDNIFNTKRNFALALGRICPEKGLHLAMDACKQAGIPFFLGVKVFDYPSHLEYFRKEIQPREDHQRRFLGPLGGKRKNVFSPAPAVCWFQASPPKRVHSSRWRRWPAAHP